MIPNAPTYKGIKNYNDGDNKDLRKQIMDVTPEAVAQMRGSAKYFQGKDTKETCYKIWKFLKNSIRYEADGEYQIVRLPSALLATKVGDCKSFSVFTSAVLTNLGIPNHYVMTSYGKDATPSHIYVVTDSGIICDAVWNQFNAEKTPTYRYKAKPNNMNNKGLGGGCTAMGATLSVPRFKVGMNGSSVPPFKVGMNGNCGCGCGCAKCGMGYPGGQGMGLSKKEANAPIRGLIRLIFQYNIGGLATYFNDAGIGDDRLGKWFTNLGGNGRDLWDDIKKGSSRPAVAKWFSNAIKNRMVRKLNKARGLSGIGADDDNVDPQTESKEVALNSDDQNAQWADLAVQLVTSDSTAGRKLLFTSLGGLAVQVVPPCAADPTGWIKTACGVGGGVAGYAIEALYSELVRVFFGKKETNMTTCTSYTGVQAVADAKNYISLATNKVSTANVVAIQTQLASKSGLVGQSAKRWLEVYKASGSPSVWDATMVDRLLDGVYWSAGKCSYESQKYLMNYIYTTVYGSNIKKKWEAAEKERGNPLPPPSSGGGLKLASGGIIMAGVALGALFLISGAKKGGKGRKL